VSISTCISNGNLASHPDGKSKKKKNSKSIPVTGRGGLWDFDMLRRQSAQSGEVVSLTFRPRSTPQKHFSASCRNVYYKLSKTQNPSAAGRIRQVENI
jgi:hypothetical protein